MPYSIMLDAGHGGRDPGAVYNGRREKDDTLRLVLAIGEILQQNDIDVQYTRTTDIYESPLQKAMEANAAGVDYFISIHRNSFPTDNVVTGVESLVYNLTGIKLKLAENINSELETIGFVNLGVKARPNLIVLRRTQMPAVLVEVGFINSNTDNMLFDQSFDAIARAIADGILETLNSNDTGNSENPGNSGNPNDPEQTEYIYRVQTGAFRNPMYANRMLNELLEQDFPAAITEGGGLFRVRVGQYDDLDDAGEMEQRLRRAGYQTVIVRE